MKRKREEISSCEITGEVAFYDCDPMQVVWHGNYLKYFEAARTALLDRHNIDLYAYHGETGFLFPITKTGTRHIHPLRYRDTYRCKAVLTDASSKLIVHFELTNATTGQLCATGFTEQVAVRTPDFELEFRLPESLRNALTGGSPDPSGASPPWTTKNK